MKLHFGVSSSRHTIRRNRQPVKQNRKHTQQGLLNRPLLLCFHQINAVVRERRIPFEIQAAEPDRAAGMQAFLAMRAEAKKNGIQDMSLDEINAEIAKARYGD